VLEKLLADVEVPVPDGLVADEVRRHLEGENRLEDDEHRAEVEVEARSAFKTQLLLDALAEREQVQVSQQELIEYLVSSSQQYGMEPNEFAKAVDEAGQVPAMVQEVARRKALAVVLSKASVKDASGNVVDLEALVPNTVDEHEGHDHSGHDHEGHSHELPVPTGPAVADPTALPSFDFGGFTPDDEADDDQPAATATEKA
jgi:trigger factor